MDTLTPTQQRLLDYLRRNENWLIKAIEDETRFGIGSEFKHHRTHQVMDEDWSFSRITKQCRDKASYQLGSSGSGNHFAEFGTAAHKKITACF